MLAAWLLMSFSAPHPFYLSVTDLKYNEKEKALQGTVKIFVNDLEDALSKIHPKRVDLINPRDTAQVTKILNDYLQTRLTMSVNNKPLPYKLLGFEHEGEAIWLYLEAGNSPVPKRIDVSNSILCDFLKDQSNIVHVEVKGEKKSLKANCPDKEMVFEF